MTIKEIADIQHRIETHRIFEQVRSKLNDLTNANCRVFDQLDHYRGSCYTHLYNEVLAPRKPTLSYADQIIFENQLIAIVCGTSNTAKNMFNPTQITKCELVAGNYLITSVWQGHTGTYSLPVEFWDLSVPHTQWVDNWIAHVRPLVNALKQRIDEAAVTPGLSASNHHEMLRRQAEKLGFILVPKPN